MLSGRRAVIGMLIAVAVNVFVIILCVLFCLSSTLFCFGEREAFYMNNDDNVSGDR